MGPTASVVHVVRCDDLVLDAEMVECKDVFRRATLERIQIFNLEVVFGPFEFQARAVGHQPLQVRLVEQIIDSFFVDLKIGAVDRELLAACSALLLDHFKQESN